MFKMLLHRPALLIISCLFLGAFTAPAFGQSCGSNCVITNPGTGVNQIITQQTGTTMSANVLNNYYLASQFQTPSGTGNNGISNAVTAACATFPAGCAVWVDPSYAQTEIPAAYQRNWYNFSWPTNSSVIDERGGVMQMSFHDPAATSPASIAGLKIIDDYDRFPLSTNTYGGYVGSSGSLNLNTNYFTGLRNTLNNYAGIPRYLYGGFHQGIYNELNAWDSGQKFNQWNVVHCYGAGDCIQRYNQLLADGGVNGVDDEGNKVADEVAEENPNVYTGTISGTVTTGSTVIPTTCTIGCNNEWPAQDRLILDTNSAKDLTGTFALGFGAPSGNIPPTVTDPNANYSVSTMVMLCYAGSDNGVGGAAGCPSGGAPSGYIPPNVSSPSLETPASSIVTGVLASWSGLPSGFCTSSSLQSSNPAGACYMPASGVGCLTDQSYDETVSYTYNSSTQQITLSNLNFVHTNAMVFATGGLCGYAVEVAADIYTATGTGGAGVQSQVFPVEGSISPTTIYYMPRRTNEGYGPAILGLSADQNQISSGQLSFSTGSSGYSLGPDGRTVTFTLNSPSGVSRSVAAYNGLQLNFDTPSNPTFGGGPYQVTWIGGNRFSYIPVSPSGAAPTSGTVTYSNMQYTLYPAATIISAYNPTTNSVDGTVTVMPNTVAWSNSDSIRVPHYHEMETTGAHYGIGQWIPSTYTGGNGFDITYFGTALLPGFAGLNITNSAPASFYQGYGGTHILPYEAHEIDGMWFSDFGFSQSPDRSVINIYNCKPVVGCSSANSNFNVIQMPVLPNAVPEYGVDVLNYDPNYQSGNRSSGLYTGRWYFNNQPDPTQTETSQASVATVEAGYMMADQSMTSPSVSTASVLTTQLTSITVYPNALTAGSVTYNYWVVGNALSSISGNKAQTAAFPFNITNGFTSPNNLICFPPQAGFASYDVLKGTTSAALITGLSATSPNGALYHQPANYSCVSDTGQATSAYTPPTVNTTGAGAFAGPVYANGGLIVGGGTAVTSISFYSPSLTPTSVGASTCSSQTFTVTGVQAADNIGSIKPPSGFSSSLFYQGYVSASNTLLITFCNISSSSITPTAGTYKFLAMH